MLPITIRKRSINKVDERCQRSHLSFRRVNSSYRKSSGYEDIKVIAMLLRGIFFEASLLYACIDHQPQQASIVV